VTVAVLAAVVLLGGCATGGYKAPKAADGRDRAFAAPAQQLNTDPATGPGTTNGGEPPTTGRDSGSTPVGPGATAPGQPAQPAATPAARTLVDLTDASADAGPAAPAYADVRGVRVEDLGDTIRVTVATSGAIPAKTASGEVEGVGFDIYRSNANDSDYQLFADGESDGWYGYLQGPKGLVAFPGTLSIGGDKLVFQVPWASIGGRAAARISVFADWSKSAVAAVALSGHDRAPDAGTAQVSP